MGGELHRVVSATHGPVHLIEVDGVMHRVSRDEGGVLRSPAPALVVATPVTVGDEVEAGAPVVKRTRVRKKYSSRATASPRASRAITEGGPWRMPLLCTSICAPSSARMT